MTTAAPNPAVKFASHIAEPVLLMKQPASSTIGRGQFATVVVATGYAELGGGGGYRLPAGLGYDAVISDSDGTAGRAWASLFAGAESGMVQSATALDGFADASVCVPFWIADENTPGALPVLAGVDRSIGGLVMGMEPGSTTIPRLLTGPLAGLLGLLSHSLQNESAGSIQYAVDASASTDLADATNPVILPRPKKRGKITSIEIIPSAALAATSGSDATITFIKIDTTGAVALASSPTVGTFTTTTALVAGVAATFTLSGTAANLLFRTTDVLGWYRTHASSGAVIPKSAIRANFQVI